MRPSSNGSSSSGSLASERVVAVVTGANGGLGFAICQVLLRCLSLPPDQPVYETTPVLSSIHPSLSSVFPSIESLTKATENGRLKNRGSFLTLVLVCRSQAKGSKTRALLLKEHELLLQTRAKGGVLAADGWWDQLDIQIQTCDQSTLGGENGVLALCERLRNTLPHITLLYLNAAHAQLLGNDYWALTKQLLTEGPIEAFTRPKFMREASGVLTKDGKSGMVWTTNVLSTYVLAKELVGLLQRSPSTLQFSPRIIHTSSRTAAFSALQDNIASDPQLIEAPRTYAASKYLATLMISYFDREYGNDKSASSDSVPAVRCLNVDPGAVRTNVMDEGFRAEGAGLAVYIAVMRWGYWLAFTICKYVLGSTWHPGSPVNASMAMVYASLMDSRFLPSTSKSPGPVFQVWARRWQKPTVAVRDVDQLGMAEDVMRSQVAEAERVLTAMKEKTSAF